METNLDTVTSSLQERMLRLELSLISKDKVLVTPMLMKMELATKLVDLKDLEEELLRISMKTHVVFLTIGLQIETEEKEDQEEPGVRDSHLKLSLRVEPMVMVGLLVRLIKKKVLEASLEENVELRQLSVLIRRITTGARVSDGESTIMIMLVLMDPDVFVNVVKEEVVARKH